MSQRANATFQAKSWEEQPHHERDDGPKLTRASVTKTFSGDIAGHETLEYLMMHRTDGSASFTRDFPSSEPHEPNERGAYGRHPA